MDLQQQIAALETDLEQLTARLADGAVIGGFWGLYDPEGLAVPDLVYALRWQDTGRCEVYILRHLSA